MLVTITGSYLWLLSMATPDGYWATTRGYWATTRGYWATNYGLATIHGLATARGLATAHDCWATIAVVALQCDRSLVATGSYFCW